MRSGRPPSLLDRPLLGGLLLQRRDQLRRQRVVLVGRRRLAELVAGRVALGQTRCSGSPAGSAATTRCGPRGSSPPAPAAGPCTSPGRGTAPARCSSPSPAPPTAPRRRSRPTPGTASGRTG